MTASSEISTQIERFYRWEIETPDKVFLRQAIGDQWKELTFREAGQEARKMVTALRDQGLKPGDHVGTYSKNCYHWVLADIATHIGGFVSVPLYSSLPGAQLAEVVKLGDLNALFVGKLDAWTPEHVDAVPDDVTVIKFPHYEGNAKVDIGDDWDALVGDNAPHTDNFVPKLDDLWTIKFTSGTTGSPKGVMLNHRAASITMVNEELTNWIGLFDLEDTKFFSYLPLNHVGERVGIVLPAIWLGGSISFSESLDRFAENMRDVQPNVFFAVPRIWTKFYQGTLAKMPEEQLDKLLADPASADGTKMMLRSALGLRDVNVCTTGAAITPAYIKDFFSKLDIHLIEAYGMTEVCGSIANSPTSDMPMDSVGKVIPAGGVRLEPETGEVLMKSPSMMMGYYKAPEKTNEVLKDGWLHSGDVGTIDEEGYLRITGRMNDAFKTAKGSFVTPAVLEEVLSENEFIEGVCVVGIGIPQPIALINLSEAGQDEDKQKSGTIHSRRH